jgi:hypothetical protein
VRTRAAKARSKRDDSFLDRLDALRVLRADENEQGALLEELAEIGAPERDIARELLFERPLLRPDEFEEAHRRMMRALEVLQRNGGRPATVTGLGPLNRPACSVVSLVMRWITRRHRFSLVDEIRGLYEAREANTVFGSPEHRMLRRARLQTTVVEQGYGHLALGLPSLLVGGAAISTTFAVLRNALGSAFSSSAGTIVVPLVLGTIVAILSWACLEAAAVARRRIRLSTDRAVRTLWDTIGACGEAPEDRSIRYALLAIGLLLVAWLAVPVTIWLVFG